MRYTTGVRGRPGTVHKWSNPMNSRNTKAEILAAHGEALDQIQELQQKLNLALALLAALVAIELLF